MAAGLFLCGLIGVVCVMMLPNEACGRKSRIIRELNCVRKLVLGPSGRPVPTSTESDCAKSKNSINPNLSVCLNSFVNIKIELFPLKGEMS